jgi:mono/diheme cytochrome c family protein
MHRALIVTAGLLAVTAVPGITGAAIAQNATITPKVKDIYKMDCAICHGDNGNGKTDVATSLGVTLLDYTDPKSLSDKSDKDIFDMIRNGKDKMPPEDASRAKDADVHALVAYLRSMSKGQTAAASTPPAPKPPGTK